jgi:hypothetical protein
MRTSVTVLVLLAISTPLVISLIVVAPIIFRAIQTHRILTSGAPATAMILRLDDTGSRINFNPVVNITMRVTPPEGEAFDAVVQQALSKLNTYTFQPGHLLNVKFDPKDRSKVAILIGSP